MVIALIRAGFVESTIVADMAFAQTLGYDKALEVTAANRVTGGWNIGGTFYADRPVPLEELNLRTLQDQADQALVNNLQTIVDIDAWLAGVGAGNTTLTTAQISPALRSLMREAKASAQQRNGVIRLLRNKLDATN